MPIKIILTGDVNLMNLTDPKVAFRLVADEFNAADVVVSNLECCLYDPASEHSVESEGFYAPAELGGQALKLAGIRAVGIANNVNYGEAAIRSSIAKLDEMGILHSGAGRNREEANAPAILEAKGIRVGFLQRTSVYWPTNHEAGTKTTGVAVIRGHTAYQLPLHKTRPNVPPANRPGVPPVIVTWADRDYLKRFTEDVSALRKKVDILIASCHWGLAREVLDYMTQIAHGAIEAGADIVMGHGPHYSLPVGSYRGKPIFYGLGSFSFHTGHGGLSHGNWLGMLARISVEKTGVKSAAFQFVRHNDRNETVPCSLADEQGALNELIAQSAEHGAVLRPVGDQVYVEYVEPKG